MNNYIRVGDYIHHKYLGNIEIVNVQKDKVITNSKKRDNLCFPFYDFGKVLFLKKKHKNKVFPSYEEYLCFCKNEKKECFISELKKIKREIEIEYNKKLQIKRKVIQGISKRIANRKEIELRKLIEKEKRKKECLKIKEKKEKIIIVKNKLLKLLKNKYDFEGFHHYTNITNFIKILKKGKLYCRKEACEFNFTDSSNQEVINHTDYHVMDYVRFYYKEKTPTFYKNEGIKVDNKKPHMPLPVLLIFDENIIMHNDILFADGNAASKYTKFTKDIEQTLLFDWKTIFKRGTIYSDKESIIENGYDKSKREIIRKRNAEFLYLKEIDIKYLKRIVFRSNADMINIVQILGKENFIARYNIKEKFKNKKNLFSLDDKKEKFHYINNFLSYYDIKPKGNNFFIMMKFNKNQVNEYQHDLKVIYEDDFIENFNMEEMDCNRKKEYDDINMYWFYKFYFDFIPLKNKKVVKIEYYMNGYLSAFWEEE